MKKLIAVMLCLFLMAGCGEEEAQPTIVKKETSSAPSASITETTIQATTSEPVKDIVHDFRNADFGMTKEEVIKSEGIEPSGENDKYIVYENVNVSSYDCNLYYEFDVSNKLVRCNYFLNDFHTNVSSYISDYDNLKSLYTKKYGEPITDDKNWLNENSLYRDPQFADDGMAICIGDLLYVTRWDNNGNDIIMFMGGDNYKITSTICYYNGKFEDYINNNKDMTGI